MKQNTKEQLEQVFIEHSLTAYAKPAFIRDVMHEDGEEMLKIVVWLITEFSNQGESQQSVFKMFTDSVDDLIKAGQVHKKAKEIVCHAINQHKQDIKHE